MGVNCNAYLSPKTRWEDVRLAAAALLGVKLEKCPSRYNVDSWWAEIPKDVPPSERWRSTSMPECIYILAPLTEGNPVSDAIKESDSSPYYMWYGLENRYIGPKATAAKIALTEALCKFFGGKMVYNDSTGKKRTFPAPPYIGAQDGKPWKTLHQAFLDIKPLTEKDMKRVEKHAAY